MNITTFSRCLAFGIAFFLPISTAMTTVTALSALAIGIYTFDKRNLSHPITISIMLFLTWYMIEVCFSIGSTSEILEGMKKMGRLMYFPILLPLFVDQKWRRNIIMGFVTAVILTVIITIYKGHIVFKDNIFTSFFVAFSVFVLLHYSYEYPKWRIPCIAAILFLSYYLLFMNIGRTGHILYFMFAFLFCCQRFVRNFKMLAISNLVVFGLIVMMFMLPSSFKNRQQLAIKEVKEYSAVSETEGMVSGDKIENTSSMGVRLILLANTWDLIKQRPMVGWGSGSYRNAYLRHAPESMKQQTLRRNPHNQYLFVWVENGIIGLVALIGMFLTMLYSFWRQGGLEGYLGVGVILAYGFGCLANSWLHDFATSSFFGLFIAVCAAAATSYKMNQDVVEKKPLFEFGPAKSLPSVSG